MSIRLMSAVFDNENLGPTPRLILLALADHADDAGRCYPSISRLCQRTGLGERAVQTNIRKLCEDGYLIIRERAGPNGSNIYFVRANPAPDAPPHDMHPAADAPPPRIRCASDPAADAPKPSGTIIEPSVPPVVPRPRKSHRGASLPEDWVPNEANISHARSKQFSDQEIQDEADQFRDYHLARGTKFKNWDAGWRTWIGNAVKFRNRGMAGRAVSGGPGQGGSLASIAARRAAQG